MSRHRDDIRLPISSVLTLVLLHRRGSELGLPRILVVGSQSVGKSSLIENITGVRLDLSGPKSISHLLV